MSPANDMWALESSPGARAATLVRRVTDLCPLPASTQRVLELTAIDNVDSREVARVVECDPALAARVLRIANSSFLGGRTHITQIRKAVVAVGLEQIRTLAAAMAMLGAFRSDAVEQVDIHETGTMAANVAGAVASRVAPAQMGAAYSCALLCEIGALATLAADGDEYVHIWRASHSDMKSWTRLARQLRAMRELERYGASTATLSALLFVRNSLPSTMVHAVGADDIQDASAPILGRIVAFARLAAAALIDERADSKVAESLQDIVARTSLVELAEGEIVERCLTARRSCNAAVRHVRGAR